MTSYEPDKNPEQCCLQKIMLDIFSGTFPFQKFLNSWHNILYTSWQIWAPLQGSMKQFFLREIELLWTFFWSLIYCYRSQRRTGNALVIIFRNFFQWKKLRQVKIFFLLIHTVWKISFWKSITIVSTNDILYTYPKFELWVPRVSRKIGFRQVE